MLWRNHCKPDESESSAETACKRSDSDTDSVMEHACKFTGTAVEAGLL